MKIFYYEKVTSTMDVAKNVMQQLQQPCVIVAKEQTAGRGKPGNSWISNKGNLLCSFVYPEYPASPAYERSWFVFFAVAVGLTIQSFLPSVKVKYKNPNDVYVNGKKICGVLVEKHDKYIVAGVGVNIIFTHNSFISLEELGCKVSAEYFLQQMINKIYIMEYYGKPDFMKIWKENMI